MEKAREVTVAVLVAVGCNEELRFVSQKLVSIQIL